MNLFSLSASQAREYPFAGYGEDHLFGYKLRQDRLVKRQGLRKLVRYLNILFVSGTGFTSKRRGQAKRGYSRSPQQGTERTKKWESSEKNADPSGSANTQSTFKGVKAPSQKLIT